MLIWYFSNNLDIYDMLKNYQKNISVYGCSSIQGTTFYSCWNFMKPGSQSGTYHLSFRSPLKLRLGPPKWFQWLKWRENIMLICHENFCRQDTTQTLEIISLIPPISLPYNGHSKSRFFCAVKTLVLKFCARKSAKISLKIT